MSLIVSTGVYNIDDLSYKQLTTSSIEKEGYTIYGANGKYSASAGTDETYSWITISLSSSTTEYEGDELLGFQINNKVGDSYSTSPPKFKASVSGFNFKYYDVTAEILGSKNGVNWESLESEKLSDSKTSITTTYGSGTTAIIDKRYGKVRFAVRPKEFDITFKLTKNKSTRNTYTIPIQKTDYYGESLAYVDLDNYLIELNDKQETDDGEFSIVGYHQDNPNCWWDGNFSQCRSTIFVYSDEPVYYANFVPNTYTIVYHGNGNTGGSTESSSHTYDTAKALTSNGFTKTGYRFIGWSTSENGSVVYSDKQSVTNLTATDGETVKLYAKWELIDYSISYTLNGGSHGENHPTTATYNNVINISNPTRTGYKFTGWSASGLSNTAMTGTSSSLSYLSTWDGNLTKNTYFANLTTTNNGKVSLTANWTKNGITATLYQNYYPGDTTTIGSPISEYYVPGGTKLLKLPDKPTRTGYSFKGWNTKNDGSGKYYTSETNFNVINNNLDDKTGVLSSHCVATANAGNIEFTLYAIWEANEYKVTLDQQGGSGGTTTITATYDSAMPTITVPSKFGYTFEGYYDSSGTKYYNANGTSARNWDKDSTATLKAKWTAYDYTLILNGNGGITSDKQTTKTITGYYESNLTLPSKPFTRAGYIFKGWSTTKDGAVKYLDGANYSSLITSNPTSITLYAQWEETIASGITEVYEDAGTYYINTAADLAKLIYTTEDQDVGNGYLFIQTANIDLSNLTYLPIGRLNSFSATYDGQGYTISGLRTYNGTDAKGNYLETNGGLFANASGATIKNVIIEDATIYGQNAGIIAGSGNEGTKISNCVVSGSVNGSTVGSIIGNGNGANISACLAKGVNTASFAGGSASSASVDSCIYELTGGTKGASDSFDNYSAWIYPSNFAYPMPKAFIWYPYPELSEDSLNTWLGK